MSEITREINDINTVLQDINEHKFNEINLRAKALHLECNTKKLKIFRFVYNMN